MCSSCREGAMSPEAVPAKTRRPDAKIASGASVIVSTTTSPRMPWALRTRPTMMNSGVVIAVSPSVLRLVLVRDGHSLGLQLVAEAGLVALLEDAGLAEQRADGVRGLRADAEPVIHAVGVQVEGLVARAR